MPKPASAAATRAGTLSLRKAARAPVPAPEIGHAAVCLPAVRGHRCAWKTRDPNKRTMRLRRRRFLRQLVTNLFPLGGDTDGVVLRGAFARNGTFVGVVRDIFVSYVVSWPDLRREYSVVSQIDGVATHVAAAPSGTHFAIALQYPVVPNQLRNGDPAGLVVCDIENETLDRYLDDSVEVPVWLPDVLRSTWAPDSSRVALAPVVRNEDVVTALFTLNPSALTWLPGIAELWDSDGLLLRRGLEVHERCFRWRSPGKPLEPCAYPLRRSSPSGRFTLDLEDRRHNCLCVGDRFAILETRGRLLALDLETREMSFLCDPGLNLIAATDDGRRFVFESTVTGAILGGTL